MIPLPSECFEIIRWDYMNNELSIALIDCRDTTNSTWAVRDATIIVMTVLFILIIDEIIWNLNKGIICILWRVSEKNRTGCDRQGQVGKTEPFLSILNGGDLISTWLWRWWKKTRSQTDDGEAIQRSSHWQEESAIPTTEEIQGKGDVREARSQGLPDRSWDPGTKGCQKNNMNHKVQALLSNITWSWKNCPESSLPPPPASSHWLNSARSSLTRQSRETWFADASTATDSTEIYSNLGVERNLHAYEVSVEELLHRLKRSHLDSGFQHLVGMPKDSEAWSQVIILLWVYLKHKMLETQKMRGMTVPHLLGGLFLFLHLESP